MNSLNLYTLFLSPRDREINEGYAMRILNLVK